jgi:hypothetical protein
LEYPHPNKLLYFSDLNLDERKYKKTDTAGHGPLYFYYTNDEEGLQYEVTQGLVMTVLYFSTPKYNYLRCSKAP